MFSFFRKNKHIVEAPSKARESTTVYKLYYNPAEQNSMSVLSLLKKAHVNIEVHDMRHVNRTKIQIESWLKELNRRPYELSQCEIDPDSACAFGMSPIEDIDDSDVLNKLIQDPAFLLLPIVERWDGDHLSGVIVGHPPEMIDILLEL